MKAFLIKAERDENHSLHESGHSSNQDNLSQGVQNRGSIIIITSLRHDKNIESTNNSNNYAKVQEF